MKRSTSKNQSTTFVSRLIALPGMPGMFGIEVPARVIEKTAAKMKARFVCVLNERLTFQCGLMPLGKGRGYLFVSKSRREALGLSANGKVTVKLTLDKSRYGLKMPTELKELLKQDSEGNERFHKLTPGKQRNIIYYVSQAKTVNTRVERSFQLIGNLKKLPPGKESMRDLFSKNHDASAERPLSIGSAPGGSKPASISFEDLTGRKSPK